MELWEVLKALDENHQKKFIHESGDQEVFFNGGIIVKEGDSRKLMYLHNWQEVKQSVTWQEAIEAWVNGKTIKCTIQGSDYVFDGHKPKLRGQIDTIDRSQLRNGTWYIED